MTQIEEILQQVLAPTRVKVYFGEQALSDLEKYQPEQRETILALIIARARKGPLLKPRGIGQPLRGELHGYTKIKPKSQAIRIVYRPREVEDHIRMEVIAIGPRDKNKVYKAAAKRLLAFQLEMERKQSNRDGHNEY